ncbi:phosphorylated adapter RNA export protein [Anguilla rostrata]|uniref:phosphorylated adapter RNA export protein n=1 Tax=Anguilla rostrata TaxID=7938 RepID=UPI0030D2B22B
MAAVSGDRMDDLEDGEISGSDSDSAMGVAGYERPQKPTVMAFSGHAFQSREPPRQTAPPVAAGYRSAAAGADSSASGSDSEEEAAVWKRKRQRCSDAPQAPPPSARRAPPLPAAQAPGRKVNNIWGSVVQEQSQEAVAAELGILGMEGEVSMSSRQCETYNYVLARKLMEKEREQEAAGAAAMLDSQLDDYMQRRAGENGDGGGEHKRKRPTKERLGPRAEMDFEGRYEITEDDSDDRVTDEIVHRLREPKKDLMERVVRTIGKKKAIELLAETATVEQNGGILTVDGSRRRTPGGVYLNLLKNTPSITGKQVKEIFYDENQRDYSSKKAAKKRRRHELCKKMKQAINALDLQEHDDGSRETFASDTNEALESLEDAAEPDPPQPPPDFALGTEDAAVVYNSSDLEVF